MSELTILARLKDALPLVEDPGKESNSALRKQAYSVAKVLCEQNSHLRSDYELQSLVVAGPSQYKFYITMGANVLILAVFESKVHPGAAVSFLAEVRRLFIDEVKREHGIGAAVNLAATIDQTSIAFQYIKLDRAIQRKRQEFRESSRNDSLRRLNHSLEEVSQLVQRNINDLLLRGENLDAVSNRADQLRESSKAFAVHARKLSRSAFMQTYGPFIALALVILVVSLIIFLL